MLLTVFLLTLLCHHFSFLIKKTKLIFLFSHKHSVTFNQLVCLFKQLGNTLWLCIKSTDFKTFTMPSLVKTHTFLFHGDQFSLFCCTNLLAYYLYKVYTAYQLSLNELNSRSYYSFYTYHANHRIKSDLISNRMVYLHCKLTFNTRLKFSLPYRCRIQFFPCILSALIKSFLS